MADNNLQILIGADGKPLTRTLEQLQADLKRFENALKTAVDPGNISELNRSLLETKKNITSLKSFTGGGFVDLDRQARQARTSVFAFNQVLREAPAFAYSAQTGILALSNNIPILVDSIKNARASGASFGSIFKDIGKSLLSFPSLLTIGVSALAIFGDKIFNTGKKAKEADDKFKQFLGSIRSAGQIQDDAAGGVEGQIAKVRALADAVNDETRSLTERQRALNQLKQINKEYFGDLVLGKGAVDGLRVATEEYTKALVQEAVVKGFVDEITKISTELRKADRKVKESADAYESYTAAIEDARAALKGEANAQGEVLKNQGLTVRKQNELRGVFNQAREEANAYRKELEATIDELNLAVKSGTKFKELTATPDTKDKPIFDIAKELGELGRKSQIALNEWFYKIEQDSEKAVDEYYANLFRVVKGHSHARDAIAKGLVDLPNPKSSTESQLPLQELSIFDKEGQLLAEFQKLGKKPPDLTWLSDAGARAMILKDQLAGVNAKFTTMQEAALLLAPVFDEIFTSILDGSKDAFSAFTDALKNLLKQLVVTVAKAAALAAIMSAISGGGAGNSFMDFFKGALGGSGGSGGGGFLKSLITGGGVANDSINRSMTGMAAQSINVVVDGQIQGDVIRLIQQRAIQSAERRF